MRVFHSLALVPVALLQFPWRGTFDALRHRFRDDHLALTAGSLTFTSTLSLVPLFTVVLAVFTAFPMFSTIQSSLEKWLVQSLIPPTIASQVLGYMTQFTAQSNRLGLLGLAVVLTTALALILTIDKTLNSIWRVRQVRPLPQRVAIYWAALTLGPLVLGASLAITTYVLTQSAHAVGGPGESALSRVLFGALELTLLSGGLTLVYRYVPNTDVRLGHALAGGLFAGIGIELAKKALAVYLSSVPTYSVVYGAFATAPILLLWIYLMWLVVLLGAVLAAYLPSLLAGVARRGGTPGWSFQLALEILQLLAKRQGQAAGQSGLTRAGMARQLRVEGLELEPVLETLQSLGWVGLLQPHDAAPRSRWVLLTNPAQTPLRPLVERLLLPRMPSTEAVWAQAHWHGVHLAAALGLEPPPPSERLSQSG